MKKCIFCNKEQKAIALHVNGNSLCMLCFNYTKEAIDTKARPSWPAPFEAAEPPMAENHIAPPPPTPPVQNA